MITLTGLQIKELAEFAGLTVAGNPDGYELETPITIADCPPDGIRNDGEPSDPGAVSHYEFIAYCSEYPEEGCIGLGPETSPPPANQSAHGGRPMTLRECMEAEDASQSAPSDGSQSACNDHGCGKDRERKMVTIAEGVFCDPCIAPLVRALNDAGIATVASCCGHKHRPGTIALKDGRWLVIARDDSEHRRIEALFPADINGETHAPSDGGGELLPCPFCGGRAERDQIGHVMCATGWPCAHTAYFNSGTPDERDALAIAAWNRRLATAGQGVEVRGG